MVTKTQAKTKEPAKKESAEKVLDKQHVEAIKTMADACMEISYEVYGLPTSRTASDGARNKMVETVGGKKRGFSISKKLFCAKHPLITEFNAARRKLDQWRDGFVIVKAAEAVSDDEDKAKITAGVRLILTKDIPEFEKGFKVRVDEYYAAAKKLQEHMRKPYHDGKKEWPGILDADREELGTDFNEQDYPADVQDCVRVVMPVYNAYDVSVKLPAEVRKRQEHRLAEALNGTLETATGYICNTLTGIFETFANQLVNRTRIYPDVNGKFGKYHGAEVVSLRTNLTDDSVPAGKVIPKIRYKEPDPENPDKEKSVIVELDMMEEGDDYEKKLKPNTTEERKSLNKSVLDNLFEQMETISRVRTMLGPYGDKIENTLETVKEIMKNAGKNSEAVLNEAKNSVTFRKSLATALTEAVEQLADTAETAKKVRRRINTSLIGIGSDE